LRSDSKLFLEKLVAGAGHPALLFASGERQCAKEGSWFPTLRQKKGEGWGTVSFAVNRRVGQPRMGPFTLAHNLLAPKNIIDLWQICDSLLCCRIQIASGVCSWIDATL
jgi:hypothetical protein